MNPVLELAKLLKKTDTYIGEVLDTSNGNIKVSGERGTITLRNTTATQFKTGDSVIVRQGVIVGRLRNSNSVPSYYV